MTKILNVGIPLLLLFYLGQLACSPEPTARPVVETKPLTKFQTGLLGDWRLVEHTYEDPTDPNNVTQWLAIDSTSQYAVRFDKEGIFSLITDGEIWRSTPYSIIDTTKLWIKDIGALSDTVFIGEADQEQLILFFSETDAQLGKKYLKIK